MNKIDENSQNVTEMVRTVIKHMNDFQDVISQISDKTSKINDIVFQTKLLSFNASIEAARAGQHGRGFSVVAEEVGKLAKISGTAAADIHQLLDKSKGRVEGLVKVTGENIQEGKTVYDDAKVIFTDILTSIDKVNNHMKDISSATNEQGQGIRQVSETISTVDKLAAENAKVAASSAMISSELVVSGNNLKELFDDVTKYVFGTEMKQDVNTHSSENDQYLSSYDNVENRKDELEDSYEFEKEDNTVYPGIGTATDSAAFDKLGIPLANKFDSDHHSGINKESDKNLVVPGVKESDKLAEIVDELASKTHSSSYIEPEPVENSEIKKIDPDGDDFE
jgi:methyl-accepting chemotaxis protein